MKITIHESKDAMGRIAAAEGAERIRRALGARGTAAVILATGASQFEVLASLAAETGIDWTRVEIFHLDEYIALPESHPASFRRFLRERFIDRLPSRPACFHAIDGEGDPAEECRRLRESIADVTVDVAFVGIGENGHLAFNDPPADFETREPYIVVDLDEVCRNQQLGEGWFPSLDAVPRRAISMSIQRIMESQAIVCTVPDARKAAAVESALQGPVTPDTPASILQRHGDCSMLLDRRSAARLKSQGS